ncbi:MAG: hypothetical protein ABSA83_05680 [Verrucomicrobiota bacterium]
METYECPIWNGELDSFSLVRLKSHLSNDDAAAFLEQIVSAELRQLYLGHISRECNKPELACLAVRNCLQRIGATHVSVEHTLQNVPCPTLVLQSPNLDLNLNLNLGPNP